VIDSMKAVFEGSSVLRGLGPVLTFSFTKSFGSAVMCLLGGAPRRVGFAGWPFSFLYTDRISRSAAGREHLVQTYCRLVESVGIRVSERIPYVEPTEEDSFKGRRILERFGLVEGNYVCLFPGARYGPAKRWEPRRFALLGDAAVDKLHLTVVLLGGPGDAAACGTVQDAINAESLNLCGKLDFSSLVGTLRLCHATVSNDSGGMHLAAALGVPVVGLFFSTDPRWTGPVSPRSVILYNRMECSPCFARKCERGNLCTQSIAVEEVMDALGKATRIPV
jgi:heptosyltransferase-2